MQKGKKNKYGGRRVGICHSTSINTMAHLWMPFVRVSLRDKLLAFNRPWHPTPGWLGDSDQRKGRFDKWYKLTEKVGCKVVDLYWRARPEKHKALVEEFHAQHRRSQNPS